MKRRRRRRRRLRRKQMGFIKWFKSLSLLNKILLITAAVLVATIASMIIYAYSLYGKIQTPEIDEKKIVINEMDESVGEGYTNFVLFGGDSRSGEVTKNLNTDTIIIVSLNNKTKEIKMVSVYRDTLLDLSNGKIQKCNSAYSRGGAMQAINMLNMNLDLNIKKYVTVDFSAVVDLVDMVGGIEVDVKEKEWKEVNKYLYETAGVAGKTPRPLTHAGVQKLDGVQATTYARIRKNVGDDFARTERQRLVIQKVVEKAMKSDLATINKIVNELFPRIATNFTLTEVLSYAKDFKKYKFTETSGFPFEQSTGTIRGRGSSVFTTNLKKNVSMLHEFLYGTEGYEPSSTVARISANIAEIVRTQRIESSGEDEEDEDGENSENGEGNEDGEGGGTEGGGTEGGGTEGGGNAGGGTEGGGTEGGGTEGGGTEGGGTEGGGNAGGGNQGGGSEDGGNSEDNPVTP